MVEEDDVAWPNNSYAESRPMGNAAEVARAADLLANAERPAMIIGKGVRWSEPIAELRGLVESLGMPFISAPMGRG